MAQRRNIYPWSLQELLHPHWTEEQPPPWAPVPFYTPPPGPPSAQLAMFAEAVVARLPHWAVVLDMAAFEAFLLILEILNLFPALTIEGELALDDTLPALERYMQGPRKMNLAGPERMELLDAADNWRTFLEAMVQDFGYVEMGNQRRLILGAVNVIYIITSHIRGYPEEKVDQLRWVLTELLLATDSLLGFDAAKELAEIYWHRLHSRLAWFRED